MILACLFSSVMAFANPVADLFPHLIEQAKTAKYSTLTKSENIDIGELTHSEYPSGIAYGAQITKLIDLPFAQIKKYLETPGNLEKVVETVKTQTNVVASNAQPREVTVKLEIKVPVVPNFHTQDRVDIRDLPDGRGLMEWTQIGDDGDLVYNQGVVVTEPDREKTKLFVVGIYIIKPERKVPWVGRGVASRFTRDHYSNYITALETLVSSDKKLLDNSHGN